MRASSSGPRGPGRPVRRIRTRRSCPISSRSLHLQRSRPPSLGARDTRRVVRCRHRVGRGRRAALPRLRPPRGRRLWTAPGLLRLPKQSVYGTVRPISGVIPREKARNNTHEERTVDHPRRAGRRGLSRTGAGSGGAQRRRSSRGGSSRACCRQGSGSSARTTPARTPAGGWTARVCPARRSTRRARSARS